jgi:hypothetical protein
VVGAAVAAGGGVDCENEEKEYVSESATQKITFLKIEF